MLLKGEMLRGTITITWSAHESERGHWIVSCKAPGHIQLDREIDAVNPYALLDRMLDAAFESCCRLFPERAPPRPKPPALVLSKRKAPSRRASR